MRLRDELAAAARRGDPNARARLLLDDGRRGVTYPMDRVRPVIEDPPGRWAWGRLDGWGLVETAGFWVDNVRNRRGVVERRMPGAPDQLTAVAHTRLSNDWRISTVWLCVDHCHSAKGAAVLFETMLFTHDDGPADNWAWRYQNEDCARLGHRLAEMALAQALLSSREPDLGQESALRLDRLFSGLWLAPAAAFERAISRAAREAP